MLVSRCRTSTDDPSWEVVLSSTSVGRSMRPVQASLLTRSVAGRSLPVPGSPKSSGESQGALPPEVILWKMHTVIVGHD